MNEIGVCIYWGPWGGELVQAPIVSLGEGSDYLVPETPSLVKEDQVWIILNDASRSVYSFYAKVLCSNSQDAVQLLVSFTMSKNRHLANKSPLDLLEALKAQFERLFIINKDVVRPCSKRIDAAFAQLLANYPLENCPWYVFKMEGLQPGSFRVEDRAQLDALMRYNAYPALAHVGHLELGFNCKSTVDINTKGESADDSKKKKRKWWQREKRPQAAAPAQPKPQEKEPKLVKPSVPTSPQKPAETTASPVAQNKGYQVWLNGEPQNVFLRWDDAEYIVHRESTEDYRYENLRVKLGALKAAPKRRLATLSGRTVAQLDEKNNRINCEMKPVERWLLKEIAFTPDSDVEARKFVKYNPDKFQVLIGREPLTDDRIKPSVAKKAVEKNNIRITPKEAEGYRFSVASAKIAKDRLVVTIEAKNLSIKNDGRKPAGFRRDPIVIQKNDNKEVGKDKPVLTKRSKPNWIAEVKIWRVFHPILFKLIIAFIVVLTSVSIILIDQANDRRKKRRLREEWVAAELSVFQQCTTADQCRQYLKDNPYGLYRDQVDSLLNVYVQDSIAEMKRDPEKAAYYMCLKKDTIDSYNACVDYLAEFGQGRYESQVIERKIQLQEEYEYEDFKLYNVCIDKTYGWYKRNSVCDTYLSKFKYGKNRDKIESLKRIITAELRKGQKKKLALLNKGDLEAFGDNSEGYLDGLDYLTAVWLLKGGRVYSSDDLFFHGGNLMKFVQSQDGQLCVAYNYKKLSVGPLLFWASEEWKTIDTSVEQTISAFRDGKGFRFDGWFEVSMIYHNVADYLEYSVDDFNRRQKQAEWQRKQEMNKQKKLL